MSGNNLVAYKPDGSIVTLEVKGASVSDSHFRVNGYETKTVTDEEFGALGDGVTDDTTAIQGAIDAAVADGWGEVYLPPGDYVVTSLDISAATRLIMRGAGMYQTRIIWDNADWCIDTGTTSTLGNQSKIELRDFAIRGQWDVYQDDAPAYSPIRLYGVDDLRIREVRVENCTYFGFVIRGCRRVFVTGCQVYEVGRDGISLRQCHFSQVNSCEIDHCDDDAITNSGDYSAGASKRGFVAVGNRISDSQGIVCSGVRRATITGNQLERIRSRAIWVGSGDSKQVSHSVTIANNIITDVFDRDDIDALATNAFYICVASDSQVGDGIAVPGLPQVTTGTFEDLDPALNVEDGTSPIPPAMWINITGNVLARTLEIGATYSDYGFGQMFTRNGYLDPVITSDILYTTSRGVALELCRGINVSNNIFRGMRYSILFSPSPTGTDVKDVHIDNNIFERFDYGVLFGSGVTGATNVRITNNTFNADPYHEATNRGSGGTWGTQGGPYGVFGTGYEGVLISRNTFRNINTPFDDMASAGQETAIVQDNIWECNPTAVGYNAANIGIGNIPQGGPWGIHRIVDGDPTSATYEQTLNLCQNSKSAIPSTGTYVQGHICYDNSGGTTIGWKRMTTGSNHVLATDWQAF